jgi:hypothetical protein
MSFHAHEVLESAGVLRYVPDAYHVSFSHSFSITHLLDIFILIACLPLNRFETHPNVLKLSFFTIISYFPIMSLRDYLELLDFFKLLDYFFPIPNHMCNYRFSLTSSNNVLVKRAN